MFLGPEDQSEQGKPHHPNKTQVFVGAKPSQPDENEYDKVSRTSARPASNRSSIIRDLPAKDKHPQTKLGRWWARRRSNSNCSATPSQVSQAPSQAQSDTSSRFRISRMISGVGDRLRPKK